MWIAKDKDGRIFLYTEKPKKERDIWSTEGRILLLIEEKDLPEGINLNWEDEEPIKVNVNITKAPDDEVIISKDRYEQLLQYELERKQRQAMILSFMQNK